MIINQLHKDEFGEQLSKIVFPSQPINSIEYLKGRDVELETMTVHCINLAVISLFMVIVGLAKAH